MSIADDMTLNWGVWVKKQHIKCDIFVVSDQNGSQRKAFILSADPREDKELANFIMEACNGYAKLKQENAKLKASGEMNQSEFANAQYSLVADKRQLCASIRVALEILDSGNTTEVQRTLMAALSAANR